MEKLPWLLLLYALPAKRTTARVNLWRRLKKFGAISLKASAYLLPDNATHFERFQWLGSQIRDDGGEATLIRVAEIDGLSQEQIIEQFNSARTADYNEIIASLQEAIDLAHKSKVAPGAEELAKSRNHLNEIKEIDYFNAPAGHRAQMLLQRAEKLALPRRKDASLPVLNRKAFQGKSWLTRPRPGIDRVGSAWLIQRFIDDHPKFLFGIAKEKFPEALPFDMAGVEFSHHGDNCTFETFLKRFAIDDRAAQKIGQMIHDADLEDGKFQRVECMGLNMIFEGWAKSGLSDQGILRKGSDCFDALYQRLKK